MDRSQEPHWVENIEELYDPNRKPLYFCFAEYACVRLLDCPYHLDKTYLYRIPDDCRNLIRIGSFVMIPYGRANRQVIGIVRKFSDDAEIDNNKIKPLDSVAVPTIFVSEELLSLADFTATRCMCTFGEAARLLLPPAFFASLKEAYSVTAKGAESRINDKEYVYYNSLLDYIRRRQSVTTDDISFEFPSGGREALSYLRDNGYVKKTRDIPQMIGAVRQIYSIALEKSTVEDILGGRGIIKLRGEKQMAVLRYLSEHGEADIGEIGEKTGASAQTVKSLLERGILRHRRERVRRDLEFMNAKPVGPAREIVLSPAQQRAYDEIESYYLPDKPAAVLLHGVTGSGKTSVILRLIDRVIADKKQVIVLIPEIALTPQTFSIFSARYERIALIHSGFTHAERFDAYTRIRNGEVDVVIGTRSAVFAPVPELGAIIIDEEHEHTYKSEMSPRYHARDIAKFRCVTKNALLLMASATPDVESYKNALDGKYALVRLGERYGDAVLPDVRVVRTLKGGADVLSPELVREVNERLQRKEQAIIFINRRGFNHFFICSECGEVIRCPNCDVSMTYHIKDGDYASGLMRCHICGYEQREKPRCKKCGSERFIKFGYGTQKIEQEIARVFPNARIMRMDADSISKDKDAYFAKLNAFKNHEADILIGTSMITKGHDFPNVTFVGVLLADGALRIDDYRASERTFSMITQVIGRAGRSSKKGLAIIHALNPESDAIACACEQDYHKFYVRDIAVRERLNFPPFCDVVLIEFTSESESLLRPYAEKYALMIRRLAEEDFSDIPLVIYGPIEPHVYRAEGKYRLRLVLKCKINPRLRSMLDVLLTEHSKCAYPTKPTMTVNFSPTAI